MAIGATTSCGKTVIHTGCTERIIAPRFSSFSPAQASLLTAASIGCASIPTIGMFLAGAMLGVVPFTWPAIIVVGGSLLFTTLISIVYTSRAHEKRHLAYLQNKAVVESKKKKSQSWGSLPRS